MSIKRTKKSISIIRFRPQTGSVSITRNGDKEEERYVNISRTSSERMSHLWTKAVRTDGWKIDISGNGVFILLTNNKELL